MVTKKTRWLSAIAAVIMLVSMLAGIVVPAGAETGSAILSALQKKYDVLQQEDFVEVRETTVAEMRDKIAEQIAGYEAADADYEREIYEKIGTQADEAFVAENKGNLVSGLILRYSVKGYYEELGYDSEASTYYISDAEDWAAAAASGSLFIGKTLLVTNDIDFEGEKVDPLTANEMAFQGVLDGQGHRFINMVIEIGDTTAEKSYKYGGLVAALTGGTIKNLGLDGGAVNFDGLDTVTDRNEGVGSFAGYIGKDGLLQNCWSTMTVTNKGDVIADGKNGVSGLIGWGEGGAIDNCFFAGTVNNTGDKRAATDLISYTANAVKVYNSIGAGTLNCGVSRNPAAIGIHYNAYTDIENFGVYNSYAVGHNAIRHRANYDPYNYKTTDDNGNTVYKNYVTLPDTDITFTKDIVHKYTPEECNAAYMIDTLEEAVWAVNRRFDTTHQSSDREYVISVDENGKLYMAKNESDCVYRKVTIEGSASGVYYFKEGAKINLLEDLNLLVADSVTIEQKEFASALNGYDLTVPAGDITINITYTLAGDIQRYATELTKRVAKYEKLDFDLFDCAQLLKDWFASAQTELAKEEKDLEMIQTLLEIESGEDGFVHIMALLPGVYPNAQDYEAYQEFNPEQEWAINSAEDWLAMIDLSKTNTFEGDTFHVLKDIDFGGQKMAPLNYIENQVAQTDVNALSFKGTIEGHGNAFIDVNVYAGSSSGSTVAAGLIGKLGDGAVIREFGVESGTIEVASRNYDQASTFGEMVGAATLTKVWSGANIICNTGTKSGSHGIIAHSQYSLGLVNGAYFYGTLITTGADDTRAMAIAGDNMRDMNVFNTLSAPIVSDSVENSKAYAGIRYSSSGNTYFGNNYGVNIPGDYNNIGKENTSDMVASAVEGAYKINQNNSGLTGANGNLIKSVYFTMKDGKIAFGADDGSDQIRKITFKNSGAVVGEMYAAAGTTVQLVCEKADSFDSISVGYSSTLNGSTLELGNEDVTIEVSIDNSEAIQTQIGVVQGLLAKYEGLNPDEFANGAEITAWVAAAQKAIADEDLVALNSAVNAEAALVEATELKDGFWPTFSQYDTYKDFNKKNDWLISSKADWDAMDDYATEAPAGNYFEGFTFHLKEDVDFGDVSMGPLGIKGKDQKIFAGTIDGHGYGFKNVNIYYNKDASTGNTTYYGDDIGGSIGLIAFLGDCEIRDFGLYNGTVETKSGNGKASTSSFGCVVKNTTATFTRVWSGVNLVSVQNAHVNALVGLRENENAAVKVNGFIFTGSMAKAKKHSTEQRNTAFGVIGGIAAAPGDEGEFYNIITAPTINTTNITASFLFGFSEEDAFKAAVENGKVKNVYGYGDVAQTYRVGTSGQTAGKTTFDGVSYEMIAKGSVTAAAWTSNNNQVAGQEPVYFTLKDDEVWFGTAENQIRRVVVMADGAVIATHYVLPGETVTLNASTDYKLTEGTLSTLAGNVLTVGNENAVVTAVSCAHVDDVTYSHIAGTKTHNIHCNDCGKDFTGNCELELDSWTANDDLAIAGGVVTAGTHSAPCKYCGGVQTENCVGTLVPNTVDCTEDGTMTFDCCDREDAVATGTGKAGHTYSGNWTEEGAPVGKEIDPCEYCDAYLVRSAGKVEVSTGNLVYAGEAVDVVITLPYALTEAKIAITPAAESKYSITNVAYEDLTLENLAEQGGAYTADLKDVQAGATITVTVKVEKFGFVEDGALNVIVTDAINAEGEEVTEASATAKITLNRMRGDADADGVLTIMDPLVVLQYTVDPQVQIHTANADMNEDGVVTIADAPLIVREWMKTV